MKKWLIITLVVLLVLSLIVITTGCALLGPTPKEPDDNGNDPNGNGDDNGNDPNGNGDPNETATPTNGDPNENGDNGEPNPYSQLIEDLLDKIGDINDMSSYISALIYLIDEIPIGEVVDKVGACGGRRSPNSRRISILRYR